MHRGSSKGARTDRAPETLPLSAPQDPSAASAPRPLTIEIEVARAGRSELRRIDVPFGAPIRIALREIGLAPEGCAVLSEGRPLPLDTPLERPLRLTVVPTFSGG